MTMFVRSPKAVSVQMEFPWMSSAEASPAKTSVSQEKAPALLASVPVSGANMPVSSKKSSRAGSSSKTSQPFDLADWTKCSGNSLRSGMMRSGTVFPLPPSALLIRETVCGLLPTPTAMGGGGSSRSGARINEIPTLEGLVRAGVLVDGPNGASRLLRPPTSGDQLPNAVGGVLHPDWVEKMLGFPAGWTELDQWKPGRATRRAP
jgi:hypothetical protein